MAAKKPRRKTRLDIAEIARATVEQAIGEQLNGQPLPEPTAPESSPKTDRARKGGLKGGAARAKALSPSRRRAIAKKAARARWDKP
jgi:hypothetical protein